jgi:hypothetical protein
LPEYLLGTGQSWIVPLLKINPILALFGCLKESNPSNTGTKSIRATVDGVIQSLGHSSHQIVFGNYRIDSVADRLDMSANLAFYIC